MNINRIIGGPEKPFHSSVYVEAAKSGSMGSTSPQSFNQRARIGEGGRAIREYRDSHVGRASSLGSTPSSRLADSSKSRLSTEQRQNTTPGSIAPKRTTFREPSGRGYNPFM